jgi:hypothetical protein
MPKILNKLTQKELEQIKKTLSDAGLSNSEISRKLCASPFFITISTNSVNKKLNGEVGMSEKEIDAFKKIERNAHKFIASKNKIFR